MVNHVDTSTWTSWRLCKPTIGFIWGGTWTFVNKATTKKDTIAPLIEWLTLDITDDGLQYKWANGLFFLNDDGSAGTKDTVCSKAVQDRSDGTLSILGGQDMFKVFGPAANNAISSNKTQYDEDLNNKWTGQVTQYVEGEKTRDQAIAAFKQDVADTYRL